MYKTFKTIKFTWIFAANYLLVKYDDKTQELRININKSRESLWQLKKSNLNLALKTLKYFELLLNLGVALIDFFYCADLMVFFEIPVIALEYLSVVFAFLLYLS